MPSGYKLTIFLNSLLQHVLHDVCGGHSALTAMGDDTIQGKGLDEYWSKMNETGAIVKEVIRRS